MFIERLGLFVVDKREQSRAADFFETAALKDGGQEGAAGKKACAKGTKDGDILPLTLTLSPF